MAERPGRVPRVTISDIAKRAGVSKGAVSYALNGQPGVSDRTRERVGNAPDGYKVRATVRSSSKSGIAVLS